MHHATKKAAIAKYSGSSLTSVDLLATHIKEENPDFTFGEVLDIIEGIKALKEVPKAEAPKVELKRFDIWRGEFSLSKPRKIPGTGQTQYLRVQFQFTDPKPKKSVSVTQKDADFWNKTRFTVRKQYTELLFPEGQKLDYWWIYNDETEEYDFTIQELETA